MARLAERKLSLEVHISSDGDVAGAMDVLLVLCDDKFSALEVLRDELLRLAEQFDRSPVEALTPLHANLM